MGPASRYSAWLNKQHQAGRGREGRIEGSAQGTGALSPVAGWVARTPGVQREPFFALCRQNGGSCCCLGASARPRPRLYRIPLALNAASLLSHRTAVTHSLSHTRPSISSARSAGGVQCFVEAQESEQTSTQRKRGLLLCQLPGKSAFYCH